MRPENISVELTQILQDINEKPEARGELYCKLKKRLAKLQADGTNIPPEIASFERNLAAELMSEAQGR